jgi:hypothetical protein
VRTAPQLRSLLWFLLVVMCLPLPATAGIETEAKDTLAPLSMKVKDDELLVTGGHPNGKILIVGYARTSARYKVNFRRHRAYLTADDKGAASLKLDGGIVPLSTWVGVDVQSGRYGVIIADESPGRQRSLPPGALKKSNGKFSRLEAALPMAYVVAVRPGEGAWDASAGDGGPHDRGNGLDGRTELAVEDFQSVYEERPSPGEFRKGDLLLVFSPEQVTIFALRLEE